MFDELKKYKSGHFFVSGDEDLKNACNAPKESAGIYLVYKLAKGKIELVYVGSSGKIKQNGELQIRQGGLYDRIVNGKQFDEPRRISWIDKINSENIDALDVYWYETISKSFIDIPTTIEGIIIQRHFEVFGALPEWNKEF